MTESRIPRSTYSSAQTLALILSETPPPSSRARLEKTSFHVLSKLEEAPEEPGSFVPAVGDVITANCSDTASSTEKRSRVVLVLSLACDLPAGRCGDCMAACTALVTAAVSVAVKAPRSMFVLGSVADSGGNSRCCRSRGNRSSTFGTTASGAAGRRALTRRHSFQKV